MQLYSYYMYYTINLKKRFFYIMSLCCVLQLENFQIIINILSSFAELKFNFDHPRTPFIVVQKYIFKNILQRRKTVWLISSIYIICYRIKLFLKPWFFFLFLTMKLNEICQLFAIFDLLYIPDQQAVSIGLCRYDIIIWYDIYDIKRHELFYKLLKGNKSNLPK